MIGSIKLDDDHGINLMALTHWDADGDSAVVIHFVTGAHRAYTGERGRALLRVLRVAATPAANFGR